MVHIADDQCCQSASQAAGCGGRDRNGRCGHSRSLETWHASQGGDASHSSGPKMPLREVLADQYYRDHHANVQKTERSDKPVNTIKSIAIYAVNIPATCLFGS
jgi:hypothetical protein